MRWITVFRFNRSIITTYTRGDNMHTATMITDIDDFDFELFSKHKIGIEIQTFSQHILDSNINALIDRWKNR